MDRDYVKFGERFENEFIRQDEFENRTIEETLDIGWEVLKELPKSELFRIKSEVLDKYYKGD